MKRRLISEYMDVEYCFDKKIIVFLQSHIHKHECYHKKHTRTIS